MTVGSEDYYTAGVHPFLRTTQLSESYPERRLYMKFRVLIAVVVTSVMLLVLTMGVAFAGHSSNNGKCVAAASKANVHAQIHAGYCPGQRIGHGATP